MGRIPKANALKKDRITPPKVEKAEKNEKVIFSFESVEKNEYFNLDGTCQNWAADLFDTMQQVSKIEINDIYAGKYTGKQTPLRIHQHGNAKAPCKMPNNVSLENMWQIRISKSKGGIHGVFSENVFYVIWFDPHHNLYPSENHGGLKKVKPASTCCKDRDEMIDSLTKELNKVKQEVKDWQEIALSNEMQC